MEIEGLGTNEASTIDAFDCYRFDTDTDRKIGECLDSTEYTNQTFSYYYDCRHWDIRILRNPNQEKLQFPNNTSYTVSYSYAFISKDVIPDELKMHLEKVIEEHLGKNPRGYTSIASSTGVGNVLSPDFEIFEQLKPITEEPTPPSPISNPIINRPAPPVKFSSHAFDENGDQQILDALRSETFINTTIPYFYKGEKFEIQVIRNPDLLPLWTEGVKSSVHWPAVLTATTVLPLWLEAHIRKLAEEECGDAIIDLRKTREFLPSTYAKLNPITPSKEGDQQILEAFRSETFINTTIPYFYGGEKFEIQVIRNPDLLPLWTEGLKSPVRLPAVLTATTVLPFWLEVHVKKLAENECSDAIIDLQKTREYLPTTYATLNPINLSKEIANVQFDDEIRRIFSSNQLINRVFHYELDGKYFSVRIIHNPSNTTLSWTKSFKVDFDWKTFTINWTNKYGLFFNEKAPDALTEHLSKLVPASYWDWFFNFKVYNGTPVTSTEYEYHVSYTTKITYTLCSWFEYTRAPE